LYLNAEGLKEGTSCQYLTRKSPINRLKGSFRFRREEHLKGRDRIREVFKGKRFSCRGAKLFLLENGLPYNRICFTFPGGFGNAVKRNRAKRLGREAFRLLKPCLRSGYDMILLVYSESGTDLADRAKQLKTLFTGAGLFI
jgi:ribonuclease P protein component